MAYEKSKVSNFGRGKTLAGFEYCHQVSNVSQEVPAASELAHGELALNSADGKLYYKSGTNSVSAVSHGVSGFTGDVSFTDQNNNFHSVFMTNGIITQWTVE